jgi:ribosomal protein L12E/L44/L45/RPP1/RPP2
MCGSLASPSKGPDAWQAEDDHRTLTRAAEVQADPARMKGVVKHHQKMKKALSHVNRTISAARAMGSR